MVIFACLFRSGILAQARYTAEGEVGGWRGNDTKQQQFLFKLCSNYKKTILMIIKGREEDVVRWCCYKTVDFATSASQDGVCIITQGKCHKMI
jgi:hypothetical protein